MFVFFRRAPRSAERAVYAPAVCPCEPCARPRERGFRDLKYTLKFTLTNLTLNLEFRVLNSTRPRAQHAAAACRGGESRRAPGPDGATACPRGGGAAAEVRAARGPREHLWVARPGVGRQALRRRHHRPLRRCFPLPPPAAPIQSCHSCSCCCGRELCRLEARCCEPRSASTVSRLQRSFEEALRPALCVSSSASRKGRTVTRSGRGK